jgi:FkbM family methyltransferase
MAGVSRDIFAPHFEPNYREHPLVLVDVGASGGLNHNWKPARRHLKVIGFEPDPREYSALVERGGDDTIYFNTALFSDQRRLSLHLARKQEVSSTFMPNRDFLDAFPDAERYDILREITIDADTLDNQLANGGIHGVDFLKLDTQGSELSILRGATRTLERQIVGVEIEVEFVELYKGQPLFDEVNRFLTESGFWLFDLRRQFLKRSVGKSLGAHKGQLVFCDALYLRNQESLKTLVDRVEDPYKKKAKILNTLAICVLYGYYDYALEVLGNLTSGFDTKEAGMIEAWLKRQGSGTRWFRKLARSPKIGAALDIMANFVRGNISGWSFSDRKLGNKF